MLDTNDKCGKYRAQEKKLDIRYRMLCESIYMKCAELVNL